MPLLKKRRLLQAPFLFLVLLCSGVSSVWADVAAECRAARIDESVRVAQVLDGDTLRLATGRKLRLIGVNAPELGGDKAPEPLAEEARRFVQRFVAETGVLHLQYGVEKEDRYGRLLAHVFDGSGKSLEQGLVKEGLAFHITIGQNDFLRSCLEHAEESARRQQLGVWGQPYFQVAPPGTLQEGFRLVRGRVTNVHTPSRGSWWVDLDSKVSLVIRPADQNSFKKTDLSALVGRSVEARGWLLRREDQQKSAHRNPWMMPLSHRGMLQVLEPEKKK